MSNTNEKIAQISALTINYEKLLNDRNVSNYSINSIVSAANAIAEQIELKTKAEIKQMKDYLDIGENLDDIPF